jgi:hypothetical protein
MSTYLTWIRERNELAQALSKGSCGGTLADGVIILCTCICSMASLLWIESKEREDRKRFVEIVTSFSDQPYDTKLISVPLLAQGENDWRRWLNVSEVAFRYTGANDKTENEIVALCGSSPPRDYKRIIRQYSYANILYQDIRSGFAHTYMPTDRATIDDPLKRIFDRGLTQISYVNRMHTNNMRQIHFPLEWIAAVAANVASGMDAECLRNVKHIGENIGLSPPTRWWIAGQ